MKRSAKLKMTNLWSQCAKNFPNPFCSFSWADGHDMRTSCPRKVVYGISLMTSGESPQMIFDVIMSRFPPDYSLNIIYDNACKRVRKILSCPSASLNWNVFANPESFCWLPRRGSSLFEIIWMISHRTYFPLFPSLFFVSSAKNILIKIIFPLPFPFFIP